MSSIEKRIVQMEFENQQFERNARTTIKTMDELKKNMDFNEASSSLSKFDRTSKNFNLNPISSAVTAISDRFSTMGIIGVTALQRITNQALGMGERIAKELTIVPVKTGFDEYELKMGSVQTIMASTGASLKDVNKYLEELNLYADKTIYSFSDMTSNIGKFTNAGVSLDMAVAAIKGVSNEAAVSGANAAEASRAMYNFAQALSAGYVKLIDWKSIENANMATVEFKNELIKTGVEIGTLVEKEGQFITTTTDANGKVSDAFDATHNFNEALSNQWMTTEVLTTTLAKYADENTEIGKKAYAAAQDVKTLSMMFDTLKEAVQSGWSQTWEYIVGDFEQAKATLTKLTDIFSTVLDGISKLRNQRLKRFLDLGGRDKMISGLFYTLSAIFRIIGSISKAFRDIFPRKTAQSLVDLAGKFQAFAKSLASNQALMDKIGRTAKGFFAILDVGKTIIQALVRGALKIIATILGEMDTDILSVSASLGDLLVRFRNWFKESGLVENAIDGVVNATVTVIQKIKEFSAAIQEWWQANKPFEGTIRDYITSLGGFKGILEKIAAPFQKFFAYLQSFPKVNSMEDLRKNFKKFSEDASVVFEGFKEKAGEALETAKSFFSTVLDQMGPVGTVIRKLGNIIVSVYEYVSAQVSKIDLPVVLFAGLGIAVILALNGIAAAIKGLANLLSPVVGLINAATKAVNSFATRMKAEAIKKVAEAILILVGALALTSKIDHDRLWESVGVMGALAGGIVAITLAASKLDRVDWSVTGSIIALAGGVLLLVLAMNSLATGPDLDARVKTISTLILELASLSAVLSLVPNKNQSTAAKTMLGMAASVVIIAKAVEMISQLDAMAVEKAVDVIGEIILFLGVFMLLSNLTQGLRGDVSFNGNGNSFMQKSGGFGTLLGAAIALVVVVKAIKEIAKMSDASIEKGLGVCKDIFLAFAGLMAASFLAGASAAKAGVMLLFVTIAMNLIVPAIRNLAEIDHETTERAMETINEIGKIFAGLIAVSFLSGKNAHKAALLILAMTAALYLMPLAITAISAIDNVDLEKGITAISRIVAIFDGLVAVSALATENMKSLVVLTVAIGIIGGIVIALTAIDPEGAIKAGEGLGIAIGAMAALVGVSKLADGAKASVPILIGLSVVVGLLGFVLSVMVDHTENAENAIAAAVAIGILVGVLAGVLWAIHDIKSPSWYAIGALGVLAVVAAALGFALGAICGMNNVGVAIVVSTAISELVGVLTAALFALIPIGEVGVKAIEAAAIGAAAVDTVALVITALVALLGGINELSGGGFLSIVEQGGAILEGVGVAIGKFVGGIFAGFESARVSELPEIGENLSTFKEKAEDFFTWIGNFDTTQLDNLPKIKESLNAFGEIQWKDIPDGETLSEEFKNLGTALKRFGKALGKDFNADNVTAATAAAETLATLENNLPRNGGKLNSWLFGDQDLGEFGERIESFGESLMIFSTKVCKFKKGAVQGALDAGQMLVNMEAGLPKVGSTWDKVLHGEQNLAEFGSRVISFGTKLWLASSVLAKVDHDAVQGAADSGTMLSELESGLEPTFALDDIWSGAKDLDLFGSRIASFAGYLATASQTMNLIEVLGVGKMTYAGNMLSDFEKTLKPTGGAKSLFMGEGSLDHFGANLSALSTGLFNFFETCNTIVVNTENIDTVMSYLEKIRDIVQDVAVAENFGISLSYTMGNLVDYMSNWVEQDTGEIDAIGEEIIRGVCNGLKNGISNYSFMITTAMQSITNTIKTEIVNGLSDMSASGDVDRAIPNALKEVDNAIYDWVSTNSGDLRVNGQEIMKWVCKGLADGASNYSFLVKQAARKVADTLDTSLRDYLEVHSPSVREEKVGRYVTQGLAKGIAEDTSAEKAAAEKGASVSAALDSNLKFSTDEITAMGKAANEWVEKNKDLLTASGFTMEEIYQAAREIVGLDKVLNPKNMGSNIIEGIADGMASNVKAYTAIEKQALTVAEVFESATLDKTSAELQQMHKLYQEYMAENQELIEIFEASHIPTDEIQKAALEYAGFFYDSAELMKDAKPKYVETAKYILTGLAEGIDADDSAEEAAKKKAENIVKAFEDGLKRLETLSKRYDLEEQLWGLTEGKNATDTEKTQHEIDTKIKQLEAQADTVQKKQGEYKALVAALGEDSDKAKEAYNDWLQAQIDLHTKAQEITELQNGTLEVTRDMITDANKAYIEFMKNADIMLASGMTQEEIEKAAREKSGLEYILNPPKMDKDISDIVDRALQGVEVDLSDKSNYFTAPVAKAMTNGVATGVAKGVSAGIDKGTREARLSLKERQMEGAADEIGQMYGDNWADWLFEAADQAAGAGGYSAEQWQNEFQNTLAQQKATTGANVNKLYNYYAEMGVSGYVSSIYKNAIELYNSGAYMGNESTQGLKDETKTNSPSKVTYEIGRWFAMGFALGIRDHFNEAGISIQNATPGLLNILSNVTDNIDSMISNDFTPTITPVVDLSNVNAAAQQIDTSFSRTQTVAATVSANKVQMVAGTMLGGALGTAAQILTGNTTNNYTFNQTNNSPKALSRIDIYRNTSNQFAMLKGATNK